MQAARERNKVSKVFPTHWSSCLSTQSKPYLLKLTKPTCSLLQDKEKKKEDLKKKSHLQDFSEAGLPVVQVDKAIHGHVHHVIEKKKMKKKMMKKKQKSHLQDLGQAGLPVVQVVEAIHGHVHHVNGTAVLRAPGRPIPAVEELVPVAHPPRQWCHHLKKSIISKS